MSSASARLQREACMQDLETDIHVLATFLIILLCVLGFGLVALSVVALMDRI